jgi:double-stranded RNA-binding protein Staufen
MCLVNELARFNKVQHQYRLTDEAGPAHKKTFTVCLKIGDSEEYTASGPSIKKAQHAAAAISLEKTQFKHPSPKSRTVKNANITPTVELNALAMKRGEPTTYTFLEPGSVRQPGQYRPPYGQGRAGGPGYPPQFAVQLRVGLREFYGEGPTAQAAKHGAAGKALKALRDIPVVDGKSKLDPTSLPFIPGSEYDELKSPISLAHEIALKRNLTVYFEVTRETGPPHMRTFWTKCVVGEIVTEGEGNGKKVSKKVAAELMLDQLRQLPPVASAGLLCSPARPRKAAQGKKKSKNLIKVENETDLRLRLRLRLRLKLRLT